MTEKSSIIPDPDALEVAPGTAHQRLEGWIPELASEEDVRQALEKAFDYRGDVTVTCKNASWVEGYIYDRRTGATLADSFVRIIPNTAREKRSIAYSDIAALKFSERDPAAGKSFDAWVKKYWEKRAAGEKNIQLTPETLD